MSDHQEEKIPPLSADSVSGIPDEKTRKELNKATVDKKKLENRGTLTDLEERVKYANRVFWLMCAWLLAVFTLLVLVALGIGPGWFRLSDNVLIALVTGVSINVIGTFAVVMNYLFRSTPGGPVASDAPRKVVD